MTREQILDEAKSIVCKDRNKQYGEPEDNFEVIAKMWQVYLETNITSFDVAMMMVLFKTARISTGGYKSDSLVDLIGYAACAEECHSKTGGKNDEV